eukprot:gene11951-25037_t
MSTIDRLIHLKLVSTDLSLIDVPFVCDSPADDVRRAFDKVYGNNTMYVRRSNIGVSGLSYAYTVGHRGSAISNINMYEPSIDCDPVHSAGGWISECPLQQHLCEHTSHTEHLDQHRYQCLLQHIHAMADLWLTSTTINPSSSSLVNDIRSAASSVAPTLIASVLKVSHNPSPWVEVRILFSNSTTSELAQQALVVHLNNASQQDM